MTFHQRIGSNDAKLAVTDASEAALGQSTAGFDATKLQAGAAEFSLMRGTQSADSKTLPTIALFDSLSGEKPGAPVAMAFAEGGEKKGLFGKIKDKVKDVGEKTVDGAKTVGEKTVEGAKKVGEKSGDGAQKLGEKTTEVAKKTTGNDKPYSPRQLEIAVEKALNKHDQKTRNAVHDTLEKMSDADKQKLFKDVQKYNAEVSVAKNGTKYGSIIAGGPLGGVIGAKSSDHVGKAIPEPDSLKTFKRQINEKLRH